jgi:hypothetical protein
VVSRDTSISEFIRGAWGVSRVVGFMNMWAGAVHVHHSNLFRCPYEALKQDTAGTLTRILEFLGVTPRSAGVSLAIQESSFERLRQKEFSRRKHQGVSLDTDAFRFRRGSVGRHAAEFSRDDLAYLDDFLAHRLDAAFGRYHHRSSRTPLAFVR